MAKRRNGKRRSGEYGLIAGLLAAAARILMTALALTMTTGAALAVASQTSISSSKNPSAFNEQVTFTVAVTGTGGTPTGSITIRINGNIVGGATLSGGTATYASNAFNVGTNLVTATYNGDGTFDASTSNLLTQTVVAPAAIRVSSSANPSQLGQAVTLTATVSAYNSRPTGSVTFFDNGTALGSQVLSSAGSASITTSSLTQGTHVITARYSGDGTFSGSTSDPLLQTVSASLDSANLRSVQAAASNAAALVSGDAIAGAIVAATSENALMSPVTIGPTGVRFSFGAEPAPATSAFAGVGKVGGRAALPAPREWVGWGDIRGTNWRGGDMSGNQLNVLGGVTRLLSPDLLFGGAVGYENFRYRVDPVAGSLDGQGATLAGYGKWRAADRLWLDGAVAYSHIDYKAAAGAAAGSFSGNRWLFSLGLSGLYSLASVTFEPSARVFAIWERQGAYTDSVGTAQDARSFSTGRASVGGKFSRSYAVAGNGTLTPNIGLYADYAFSRDTSVPGLGFVPTSKRLSARLAPGVTWATSGRATIALDGSMAGLGADYKIWSLMMRGQIPF